MAAARTTRRAATRQPTSITTTDTTPPKTNTTDPHASIPTTPTTHPPALQFPPRRAVSPPLPSPLFLNVRSVLLNRHLIEPWFPSLYREELVTGEPVERLWVCDRCFRYSKEVVLGLAHRRFCSLATSVPGREVYAGSRYSIYEVDGELHPLFTQNLSLFAKLFIENKSVCFDVSTFLYYLLVDKHSPAHGPSHSQPSTTSDTSPPKKSKNKGKKNAPTAAVEQQDKVPQIVGFFSKEKLSWDNNNLACILVFPPWQKLGLGQMLMAASYELARREGRLGGPERPLSIPGKKSYLTYWSRSVATYLLSVPNKARVSVSDISEATYMIAEDVVTTLLDMGVLGTAYKGKDGQERIRLDKGSIRAWLAAKGIEAGDLLDRAAFVEEMGEDGEEGWMEQGNG